MTTLWAVVLFAIVTNRAPALLRSHWDTWPHPQQREVMRIYKQTGYLYRYPARGPGCPLTEQLLRYLGEGRTAAEE